MKLYELKAEYQQLMEKIDQYASENEGLIPDDIDAMLSGIEEDHHNKMVSCACLVKNLEADSAALKKEEKALASRRQASDKKAEAFKKYMAAYAIPGVKINDPRAAISWKKSKSIEILDKSKVPDEYCKIERTPKKKLIEAAIKSGENIEYASIVEKLNLQIK